MSGAKSVRKGKRYERRTAIELRKVFSDAGRALQFQQGHDAPDVEAGPLWVEVKSYDVPTVRTWNETEAKRRASKSKRHTIAALVQPSGGTGPVLVTLSLKALVELLLAHEKRGAVYGEGMAPAYYEHELRDDAGRYAVTLEKSCRCGHTKGQHLAGRNGRSIYECAVDGCDCERFRRA